jgi:RecB family exonuclease
VPAAPFPVIVSASAAVRLEAAAAFLRERPALQPVTIVAATRGAADDLARRVAVERRATFGLTRLSLTQFAARAATVALAAERVTPSSWLGAEAVAARAAFAAVRAASLDYFGPVARTPGFPRALARTLQELRLAGASAGALHAVKAGGRDLAHLLARMDEAFAAAGSTDRAGLFRVAARLMRERRSGGALLLLDLAIAHPAEWELVDAALGAFDDRLVTVPAAESRARAHFAELGGAVQPEQTPEPTNDLGQLRRFLFERAVQPPPRTLDGSLEFFSAPGEGRECIEIVRRMLGHARAGIRFDEMAVLVRAPQTYFGPLEGAFRRAGVPGWFDRGTRRPHPAGRAFLALLACAAESLSARRFAEYLSLGQVPAQDGEVEAAWVAPADEVSRDVLEPPADEFAAEADAASREPADADDPVRAGTVQAPWRWEALLGDASVIGGSAGRWRRRLDGLEAELRRQEAEADRQDGPGSSRARAAALGRTHLDALRRFALPVIDELAGWPDETTWRGWLERFERLLPRVVRTPAYVQRVLADLRPMADVGPVDLEEARRVLASRLSTLETEPPRRRFGRVFVGTPAQVRGRTFRVVFVPGLAERVFPQKPREDPLLLDAERRAAGLRPVIDRQIVDERLLLQLAAGAATERLHVSYPRIELSESRARVPSFYALDLVRAATGTLPDHETLEERARHAGHATLAWPAPDDPDAAIDDQEHDLAVLRRLLDADRDGVRGHAHYLLGLNDALRRSVSARWGQAQPRWAPGDGLIRHTPQIAAALAAQRLTARAYSLSALQKFSSCPYQFVLSAIFRLQPLESPVPLQSMDPLTRGSLFHDVQARFFRAMDERGALPVTPATLATAAALLDATIATVAENAYEELAPAVERVWADDVAAIRRDLHAWLRHLSEEGAEWRPRYFELAFGTVPGDRDPHSLTTDVTLPGGFRLRGAIDLIEEHQTRGTLRVTDHKTGRRPDRIEKAVVAGGAVLQPVLYAMAVEAGLGRTVSEGRLFYCTSAGGFYSHPIQLTEAARAAGLDVLRVIDRAIETGFLPPAPAEGACRWCDCRPVCGPGVPRRLERKPQAELADLIELRRKP